MRDGWYYDEGEKPVGPLSFDALVTLLRRISNAGEVNVWHAGLHEWQAAKDVSQIAALLYRRPLPIPRQILTSPVKAQPAERGDANNRRHKTRGRIALLIVLAIVLFVGTIFSTVIHDISAGGVGYLIGQFIGAAVILSLLAWPWRRSPYIAAVVLLVATFSVGLGNTQELLFRLAVRETKAALKDVGEPTPMWLTPTQMGHDERHTIKSSEPARLQGAEASTTDIWGKWADLQSRIQSEEETLAACRAGSADCPAAARQFLRIVELGRQREGRARLGEINRAVNLSIRPVDDAVQHGVADLWSTPLATLSAGAGDCEDYAIIKYVALRELGIAPDDLRILIVHNSRRRTKHAVLAVHLGEQWLILDNQTMIMVDGGDAIHYRPLFALDHRGVALDDGGVIDAAAAVVGK
jgi:predicted transglutaminase-like cysteine proteinase